MSISLNPSSLKPLLQRICAQHSLPCCSPNFLKRYPSTSPPTNCSKNTPAAGATQLYCSHSRGECSLRIRHQRRRSSSSSSAFQLANVKTNKSFPDKIRQHPQSPLSRPKWQPWPVLIPQKLNGKPHLLINLRSMNDVKVDLEAGTATLSAGTITKEVIDAATQRKHIS